jgi:aryl-alcohol dehydrogenase-like predicted oxidoreductase
MTYGSPNWRAWVLGEADSRPFLRAALDAGINFFDTADMYSLGVSEEIVGNAFAEWGIRRSDVVIATKVFNAMGPGPNDRGLSRKHIMESIDGSLKRLRMDYVDLYQIHRFDPATPVEETLDALNDVVKAGKALYLGASSTYAWEFMKMLGIQRARGYAPFVSMQNLVNLVYREEEREMLPLCRSEGIAVIPWSPLSRGFLAGNTTRDKALTVRAETDDFTRRLAGSDQDYAIRDRVVAVAGRLGIKPAQVALAWLLHQPGITAPIIGASKPHHLPEAIAALNVELDDETCRNLEELYRPRAVAGLERAPVPQRRA